MWDDENYYMVAFDSEDGTIKHYRVDKMLDIMALGKPRLGKEAFSAFDMAKYNKRLFGMYIGEEINVTLRCKNELVGVLFDCFGTDLMIIPKDADHFRTTVSVALSRQFFGWIFSIGEEIQVIGPTYVVDRMKEETRRLVSQYLE